MTTKLTVYTTGKLTATTDPRVKTGLLLPYGEPGHTNKGKVTASAGSLKIAPQLDPLTLEHEPTKVLATFESVEETPAGLLCSVRYLDTTAGNDALAEYDAGARTGLSVEIDGPVIRDGQLTAGLVTGGSQVVTPAFVSARLAAADTPQAPDMGTDPAAPPTNPTVTVNGEPVATDLIETITITTTAPKEPNPMTASAPQVQTPNLVPPPAKLTASAAELFKLLAGAQNDSKMLAALSDIVPANILSIGQAQYIGELWSGKAYQRKIIPLFNHADLTNLNVQGWRWVTKPAVGLYAGNKAAVPSGALLTEPVTLAAQRIAGAHDIDRAILDFGNAEFWAAYTAAMTESYAKVSDAYGLSQVAAAAPAVVPGAIPAGVATAMVYIVDGALAILNGTDTMPDYAVVSTDLWRGLMLTRSEDALAYLTAALGLEDGTAVNFAIRPSAALAATTVLVGCKSAVTVHELGGGAPIRVDAIDMAKGGVDKGVFGYMAVNIHDTDGLAKVHL